MRKENWSMNYRGFTVFPYRGKGEVIRVSGSKGFVDSNGYRMIKDFQGVKHPVSQIIYAVGCAYPSRYPQSYKFMKTVTVSYIDKDKSNCNYDNLKCKIKKKYLKQAKIENEIGMCFK